MNDTTRPRVRDERAVAALGTGLLSAAVLIGATYSRVRADLDLSNLAVAVVGTAGLLAIAVVSWLVGGRGRVADAAERTEALVAWPGAAGIAGVGVLIATLGNDAVATYAGGLVVLGLAVAGAVLLRAGAFVLVAIAAFGVVFVRVVDDTIGAASGDNLGIRIGAVVFVFVLVVTVAGWFLPQTRVLSGVVAGAVGVVGLGLTLLFLSLYAQFFTAPALNFHDSPTIASGGTHVFDPAPPANYLGPNPGNPTTNDVWFVIALALVLVVLWAGCSALSGHVGFRVLIVAMCVVVMPFAALALVLHHPSVWGLGAALLGGALLALVAVRRGPAAVTHD